MRARSEFLIGFGLLAITLILYFPALGVLYVADDFRIVQQIGFEDALSSFGTTSGYDRNEYRPLVALWYASSNAVWQGDSRGYHLEGILLHAINAILLFSWLALLTRSTWIGATAGAMFAVHPLNHSRVVWIAARDGTISTFLLLAALWTYTLRRRRSEMPEEERGRSAAVLFSISLVCFALGLLTYEGAVVLLAVLAGLEFFVLSPRDASLLSRFKSTLIKILPHALILAIYVAGWLLLFRAEIGRHDLALSFGNVLLNYYRLLYRLLHGHQYLAGVLYVLLLPLLFLVPRHRRPLLGFSSLFLLAAFVPFSLINGFASRFAYFSTAGYALLLAVLITAGTEKTIGPAARGLRNRLPAAAAVLLASVGCYYALGVRVRVADWMVAGEIADQIPREVKVRHPALPNGATLVFGGVPRMHGHAYIYPLGLRYSIQNLYPEVRLRVVYGEKDLETVLEGAGVDPSGSLLFQYDAEKRDLQEVDPPRRDPPPMPPDAPGRS